MRHPSLSSAPARCGRRGNTEWDGSRMLGSPLSDESLQAPKCTEEHIPAPNFGSTPPTPFSARQRREKSEGGAFRESGTGARATPHHHHRGRPPAPVQRGSRPAHLSGPSDVSVGALRAASGGCGLTTGVSTAVAEDPTPSRPSAALRFPLDEPRHSHDRSCVCNESLSDACLSQTSPLSDAIIATCVASVSNAASLSTGVRPASQAKTPSEDQRLSRDVQQSVLAAGLLVPLSAQRMACTSALSQFPGVLQRSNGRRPAERAAATNHLERPGSRLHRAQWAQRATGGAGECAESRLLQRLSVAQAMPQRMQLSPPRVQAV